MLILKRTFAIDGPDFDGRTLSGRLVPYNEVADVLDVIDGRLDRYREGFRFGAFGKQATTVEPGNLRRVGLHHTHERGLGYLGSLTGLHDAPDGLHGSFTLLRSRAPDVADLVDQGIRGLSIEFHALKTVDEAGVRWRTRAHLSGVALEPSGAYESAQVLALRAADEEAEIEAQETAERASHEAELDTWLAEEKARQAELEERYVAG